jgi:hypothetical protein
MRIVILAAFAVAACGANLPAKSEPAAPAAQNGAWDHDLLALLPEIDACIDGVSNTRTITYAGRQSDGSTLVRMRGETTRVDCRVNADAVRIRARDDALHIPGEGDAIFVRGPGENPGGECYQAPEVRDANGQVIGWMLDPEGC